MREFPDGCRAFLAVSGRQPCEKLVVGLASIVSAYDFVGGVELLLMSRLAGYPP